MKQYWWCLICSHRGQSEGSEGDAPRVQGSDAWHPHQTGGACHLRLSSLWPPQARDVLAQGKQTPCHILVRGKQWWWFVLFWWANCDFDWWWLDTVCGTWSLHSLARSLAHSLTHSRTHSLTHPMTSGCQGPMADNYTINALHLSLLSTSRGQQHEVVACPVLDLVLPGLSVILCIIRPLSFCES